jgi:hypothetical protein
MPDSKSIEQIVRQAKGELLVALRDYNATLREQALRQGSTGSRDAGRRSEVTGGRQMDGFIRVVRGAVCALGFPAGSVITGPRAALHIPGYFRATKMWDLLVIHRERLLAVLETKSIASSFGNNLNNRSEEAIGVAKDFEVAFREGRLPAPTAPWCGFLFLLPELESTAAPVKAAEPHFPVCPEFKGASYARRAEELCVRLVREKLYTATCLLLARNLGSSQVEPHYPQPDLAFEPFLRSLLAHCYVGLHR